MARIGTAAQQELAAIERALDIGAKEAWHQSQMGSGDPYLAWEAMSRSGQHHWRAIALAVLQAYSAEPMPAQIRAIIDGEAAS